jgi:hypothetical protein
VHACMHAWICSVDRSDETGGRIDRCGALQQAKRVVATPQLDHPGSHLTNSLQKFAKLFLNHPDCCLLLLIRNSSVSSGPAGTQVLIIGDNL